MRRILQIRTQAEDLLSSHLMQWEREQPDCLVEVADLTREEVDYDLLLDQIFDADSVQSW